MTSLVKSVSIWVDKSNTHVLFLPSFSTGGRAWTYSPVTVIKALILQLHGASHDEDCTCKVCAYNSHEKVRLPKIRDFKGVEEQSENDPELSYEDSILLVNRVYRDFPGLDVNRHISLIDSLDGVTEEEAYDILLSFVEEDFTGSANLNTAERTLLFSDINLSSREIYDYLVSMQLAGKEG